MIGKLLAAVSIFIVKCIYDAAAEYFRFKDQHPSINSTSACRYRYEYKHRHILNLTSFQIVHRLETYVPKNQEKAIIGAKLDSHNIHMFFRDLLYMEDLAILEEYVPLIQRKVTLSKEGEKTYRFTCNAGTTENIQDILAPDIDLVVIYNPLNDKAGDVARSVNVIISILENFREHWKFMGMVKTVSNSSVCFEFDKRFKIKNNEMYDLVFLPARFPIRYQQRALDLLAMNQQMCKYLFPKFDRLISLTSPSKNLELLNSEIASNPEQLQAVHYISSCLNPCAPYIVFGPPGTGKTATIVESILQLRLQHPGSRILVTAGSNSACDTITSRICQYFKSSQRLQKLVNRHELPVIRIRSRLVEYNEDLIPSDILCLFPKSYLKSNNTLPSCEKILLYGIVVATLSMVGKLVCADINISNSFTHIFIDEAAASTEPETLVGIMGIKKERYDKCNIILSGDHKQLGPVLKSASAIKFGLGFSLMERLLDSQCYALDKYGNYNRLLQMRLRRNYRSHKEIVKLYNFLYYNNELLAMKSQNDLKFNRSWSFLPDSLYPIVFKEVYGLTTKEGSSSSCNYLEISVLLWFIKRLIDVDGVKQTDIGVITPYKLQCQKIRQRLDNQNWSKIEVGSVENFQGREKEIIIASMVRSFVGLGFLKDSRRFNVLLSRAKSLLLIIGNPVCLRGFEDMNYVIEECKANGTFLNKNSIPKSFKTHKKIK